MRGYCPKHKMMMPVYWDKIENELRCSVCDSYCTEEYDYIQDLNFDELRQECYRLLKQVKKIKEILIKEE